MVKTRIKFSVKGSLVKELRDALSSLFGKKVQQNFSDFRPIVEEAIDEGVINSRKEFIPTPSEAAELGIGKNGSLDHERINGAWRQLLVGSESRAITFSVRKDTRKNKIGVINIKIDEQALYSARLSSVDTPDSEEIDSIPWMQWMIEGEPTGAVLPNYEFSSSVPSFSKSRTGAGRMLSVEGGLWTFSPVRLGAFTQLNKEIQRQVEKTVRNKIGRII